MESLIFLDTEFTDFKGELMSLALVPAMDHQKPLYIVLDYQTEPCDWVKQNVVPHLGDQPRVSPEFAARQVAAYLRLFKNPVVVADWPEDFVQLLRMLITGPGLMVRTPDFKMDYRQLEGFNTADFSKVPHNALEDAIALRDHCIALEAG